MDCTSRAVVTVLLGAPRVDPGLRLLRAAALRLVLRLRRRRLRNSQRRGRPRLNHRRRVPARVGQRRRWRERARLRACFCHLIAQRIRRLPQRPRRRAARSRLLRRRRCICRRCRGRRRRRACCCAPRVSGARHHRFLQRPRFLAELGVAARQRGKQRLWRRRQLREEALRRQAPRLGRLKRGKAYSRSQRREANCAAREGRASATTAPSAAPTRSFSVCVRKREVSALRRAKATPKRERTSASARPTKNASNTDSSSARRGVTLSHASMRRARGGRAPLRGAASEGPARSAPPVRCGAARPGNAAPAGRRERRAATTASGGGRRARIELGAGRECELRRVGGGLRSAPVCSAHVRVAASGNTFMGRLASTRRARSPRRATAVGPLYWRA